MKDNAMLLTRNPDVCFAQIQPDEIIILNSTDNCFYQLNESAVDLWLALDEPSNLDMLSKKLAAKYKLPHEAYEQDVLEWVTDMQHKGLIKNFPAANIA